MSINKSLYDKYGNIKIYLVNEEIVRGHSVALQEFSNYAIHSDFPKYIKKNEVWLSGRVVPEEQFILIDEALNRIKFEASGLSAKMAYDKALKLDKVLRQKMHYKWREKEQYNTIPSKIYIKEYGKLDDIKIFIVNGLLVRDFYKTDFVEGGHGFVYHFIPTKEIWIDVEVPKEERSLILLHEVVERIFMSNKMSYKKAHEKASKIEWRIRSVK